MAASPTYSVHYRSAVYIDRQTIANRYSPDGYDLNLPSLNGCGRLCAHAPVGSTHSRRPDCFLGQVGYDDLPSPLVNNRHERGAGRDLKAQPSSHLLVLVQFSVPERGLSIAGDAPVIDEAIGVLDCEEP